LSVIDRKNAEINQIQINIPRLQNDLNVALKKQDEIDATIVSARNNIAKIEDGIKRLSQAINTVRGDLNSLKITIQSNENDRNKNQK
jgi:chromosome segregation ATPase